MTIIDDIILQIKRYCLLCDGLCFFCNPVGCDMELLSIDMILRGEYYG